MRFRALLPWMLLALIVALFALGAGARGSLALQTVLTPTPLPTPTDGPLPTPTPIILIGSTSEITGMSFLLVLMVLIPVLLFRRAWSGNDKKQKKE